MRHLYGTALAGIMTAVMFFAGTWGYLQLLRLPAPAGRPDALPAGGGSLLANGAVLLALTAVMATGVLAGVLVALPRVSPLAAGLPGLLLIAWTVLYLGSVRRATEIIPFRSHAFGAGWEALLFNGVLGAVGLAMIIPMFLPSRWRLPRAAKDEDLEAMALESDQFLADLKNAKAQRRRQAPRQEAPALVGTVVRGSTGANPAIPARPGRAAQPGDSARGTGASRASRATGPLRAATGPLPSAGQPNGTGPMRTTGSFRTDAGPLPPSGRNPAGGQSRVTGSFRADANLPPRLRPTEGA